MAFRPYMQLDGAGYMAARISQGYLSQRQRNQHLLHLGYTSSHSDDSSRRMAHLLCPSRAGPQAISINLASVRPSTLRRALSELMLRLRFSAASIPPVENALVTVAISSLADIQRGYTLVVGQDWQMVFIQGEQDTATVGGCLRRILCMYDTLQFLDISIC